MGVGAWEKFIGVWGKANRSPLFVVVCFGIGEMIYVRLAQRSTDFEPCMTSVAYSEYFRSMDTCCESSM